MKKIKAIGMMSGGLDSALAAKVVSDLGVEVIMLHFMLPWAQSVPSRMKQWTAHLGVELMCVPLDENFMEVVRKPKHGYGSAMNPCIDCKIHMFRRAKEFMETMRADFIFTGEVVGQRPMSQNRQALDTIEKETGLSGRLLRPLCAKHLPLTIPEEQGLIDRNQLLAIEGRSRIEQIRLAKQFVLEDYAQPAGGCLLTEKSFESRLRDLFGHDYQQPSDTQILKWGRHFRLSDTHKVILGRDANENGQLESLARDFDYFMRLESANGPLAVLQGLNPTPEILASAAGLIQHFSKTKNDPPQSVIYWMKNEGESAAQKILAVKITEEEMGMWRI